MTRKQARLLREELSQEQRAEYASRITAHLLRHEVFQKARSIMAYVSYGSEVETDALIKTVLASGKRLFLPRCHDRGKMDAVQIDTVDTLVPGRFSIPEPNQSLKGSDKQTIELIFVPGLLFDENGARLGQGGGYYDRFLMNYQGMTCGLAFSVQVVEKLSVKPHDVSMHAIATEHGLHVIERTVGACTHL